MTIDIFPPAPLSCGEGADETMTSAVIALLNKNAQKTYRTVSPTATGTVALSFTKRTTAVTIDGVRLKGVFDSPTGVRAYQTDFRIPLVVVAVGETPRTVISIQASPRKITWPTGETPLPETPPPLVVEPLPIPSNPVLVADPGGVKATWPASPGATDYLVTWGSNSDGDSNIVVVKATSIVVPLTSAGWLCVVVRNAAGESELKCNSYSPVVTTTGIASLTWKAPTGASVDGYKVYSGTASRQYGPGVSVGNVLSYTATGLSSGKRYYFAATAIKGGVESVYSNEGFKDF